MKLYYSATSPYVRKVMACAIAAGVEGQITQVDTNPHASPGELLAENPLSKVPCLVTEDGLALFDSPVICEYLDSIGDASLFPAAGPLRWRALRLQALGDGIMDAAVLHRMDQGRPAEAARTASMDRQNQVMLRGLAMLEEAALPHHLDIGTITAACALGYLDLRFASMAWREGRPKLAAWFAAMERRPEISRTAPP